MKRIKYFLTLLTAILILLPGIQTDAKTIKKELASGAKNASFIITLDNCQSIEGKVSVKSKTSGKTITLQSVTAQTSDKNKTVVCEATGNKFYLVTNGDPVTATVTINAQFSGDGSYTVALKGGCTDKDGVYKADGINETIKVTVGASGTETEEEEEETEEEETDEEETDEEDETEEEEEDKEDETKESSTSSTKTTKNDQTGKTANTTREEVKAVEEEERVIEEFLEKAEEEIKKGNEEVKEENVVRTPKSLGSFLNYLKNFWFIFLIILLFLLICAHMLWRLLRKNRKNDYDGAPMVDYHIEDDD